MITISDKSNVDERCSARVKLKCPSNGQQLGRHLKHHQKNLNIESKKDERNGEMSHQMMIHL